MGLIRFKVFDSHARTSRHGFKTIQHRKRRCCYSATNQPRATANHKTNRNQFTTGPPKSEYRRSLARDQGSSLSKAALSTGRGCIEFQQKNSQGTCMSVCICIYIYILFLFFCLVGWLFALFGLFDLFGLFGLFACLCVCVFVWLVGWLFALFALFACLLCLCVCLVWFGLASFGLVWFGLVCLFVCLCLFVCVCVCVCVRSCMCTYMCVCVFMCICMYTIHMQTCVCMCVCVHICKHTCI